MALAAVVVQLMTAGGAGAHGERATEQRDAAADDLGKNLSALKGELSSLSEQFKAARERRRLAAEQKTREDEEWHHGPKAPPSQRATPPTGGAGTSAH
ncbi:hypothetical protein K8638_14510 [Myxococcus sp. RHST-1-4]|nr:hypothetical protein [Myxococcus sp. RHSTA-1-4]